jgi:hypothetical protein
VDIDDLSYDWRLPRIPTELARHLDLPPPSSGVFGYDFDFGLQSCVIEVWTEKSGDDDVLIPLCKRLGLNFVSNVGYPTISQVRGMLRRVRATGRPGRILYLSDFDPAGSNMPVAAGRHTQFALWRVAEMVNDEVPDIRLEPIAVTAEQVDSLGLTRQPINLEDKRKPGWEAKFGAGAVEIDALEARHPGILARLISERVSALHDQELAAHIREAEAEAEEVVEAAVEEALYPVRPELDEIREEFGAVAEEFRDELESVSRRYEERVAPLRLRLTAAREEAEINLGALEGSLELPPLPEAAPPDDGGREYLLDTRRDYLTQTGVFRSHQRKD